MTTTILNVDDDPDCSDIFAFYMEEYGIVCINAENVGEAKALFDPSAHAALVTDWHLPDGTGADVAAHARAMAPGIPLIFRSAAYTDDMLQQVKTFADALALRKDGAPEHYKKISDAIALLP